MLRYKKKYSHIICGGPLVGPGGRSNGHYKEMEYSFGLYPGKWEKRGE